ncbi:DUF4113 domain-containing protein, partial [Klebsiella variicola]
LTDDRGTESLASYLRSLTDSQLLAIKTLSMDMNAGYIRAARIHLPNAVEKIASDRFHVAKQLGEVVDKTRQNEHPHLPVESRRQAKGTQLSLFDEGRSYANSDALMNVLDTINNSGKGKVWFAGRGIAPAWSMKRDMLSPAYTTRWDSIPIATL